MFRAGFLSIIRSLVAIGICHTGYGDCLLAGTRFPASKQSQNLHDIHLILYVHDDGRRDRPKHTSYRVLFQNKINLRYCAFSWFYYRNILRCMVLQTLKNDVY